MSKFLYLIAIILITAWTVSVLVLPSKDNLYLILLAGLIALLFAISEKVLLLWNNVVNELINRF